MQNIGLKAVMFAALATFALTSIPTDALAAPRSAYKIKKDECTRKANDMHFGIHRIKRARWIKNCIAGHEA
jgi:hypothetical protein